uniref:MYND-type domain-containing protein n=1 Tax=Knipowitschia caucasica TaxID=637954 RepID=A0AAV2L1F1_KNICA
MRLESGTVFLRMSPLFQFCVTCGLSAFVKLTRCSRCHAVFFCSEACKIKSWKDGHKQMCIQLSAKSGPKACSQRRAPDAAQRKSPRGAKEAVKAPHKANIPKFIPEHKVDAVPGQPRENYSFI